MKAIKASVFCVIALLGATIAADAFAQPRGGYARGYYGHGHRHSSVNFGFVFGPGYWYPPAYYGPYYRPYYDPYYYYPPAVAVPQSPPVYIEQAQPAPSAGAPAAPAAAYWYYCAESQAYYPYARECAGPWQRIAPQPPPS
jgi:hypothetical protein